MLPFETPAKQALTRSERARLKAIYSNVVKVDLMDHQVDGITWMRSMENSTLCGGGLADDMGLGKTLQTIMCSVANGINRTLIICPNALTSGWLGEFDKLRINVTRTLYHGADRSKVDLDAFAVVVTTYGTLVSDHKANGPLFSKQWHRVVIDESQYIKNDKTKAALACFALEATYRWCLSGTPVQNNINELFASLHFLRVPSYGHYDTFVSKVICGTDATDLVEALFLRREKGTTLRLAPKRIVDYPCEFSPVENEAYRSLENKLRSKEFFKRQLARQTQQQVEGEEPAPVAPARPVRPQNGNFAGISALRMGCDDVRFVEECGCDLPEDEASSKQQAVVDLATLLALRGQKVLIFSQYLSMIARIKRHIGDKMNVWVLTGSQNTPRKRDPIISGFQSHVGGGILILQTMVGSVGLNLTQAQNVILVEPWWNPFVDEQAMDRAHRIGQQNQVTVYRCFVPNTIEERIMVLQEKKRDMVSQMWGKSMSTGSKMSKKDVRYLLGRAG